MVAPVCKTVIVKSQWCPLKRPRNLNDNQQMTLRELLQYNLKSARACLLKEQFRQLWECRSAAWAGRFPRIWRSTKASPSCSKGCCQYSLVKQRAGTTVGQHGQPGVTYDGPEVLRRDVGAQAVPILDFDRQLALMVTGDQASPPGAAPCT